ncbi:hypothetical protein [Bradyrhizobium semiaridum]|uniref:hypothetical protein n=1 Tax=Bradyrhizobium semiaridum TaxID=2821404 RepID=UPI0035D6595C
MTQPMMVVVGKKVGALGAYRDGMEIYWRSAASKDRQLVELDGWSHYDLYDKPEPVAQALAKLIPSLRQHLGTSATRPNKPDPKAASTLAERCSGQISLSAAKRGSCPAPSRPSANGVSRFVESIQSST